MNSVIEKPTKFKPATIRGLPCNGCVYVYNCGFDLKACKDFRDFVTYGGYPKGTLRSPTRKMYMKIFWEGKD